MRFLILASLIVWSSLALAQQLQQPQPALEQAMAEKIIQEMQHAVTCRGDLIGALRRVKELEAKVKELEAATEKRGN